MNTKQKNTLFLTVAALVTTGVFPPWHAMYKGRVLDLGYWWITSPPTMFGGRISGTITVSTLLVQWVLIAIAGAGALFYFKGGND